MPCELEPRVKQASSLALAWSNEHGLGPPSTLFLSHKRGVDAA
jgi:hypothetical protein